MFSFFDYVYYKACKIYAKENGAALSGVVVMAALQMLNILTILFFICVALKTKGLISKLLIIILYVSLLILNGLRYNKITYSILDEKWGIEPKGEKTKHQLIAILYVCVSFILCVGLAIYLGSKKDW